MASTRGQVRQTFCGAMNISHVCPHGDIISQGLLLHCSLYLGSSVFQQSSPEKFRFNCVDIEICVVACSTGE